MRDATIMSIVKTMGLRNFAAGDDAMSHFGIFCFNVKSTKFDNNDFCYPFRGYKCYSRPSRTVSLPKIIKKYILVA